MMRVVICISNAMIDVSAFPNRAIQAEFLLDPIGKPTLYKLYSLFQTDPHGREHQMEMIAHQDEFVDQELALATIVIKGRDEESGHAVRLKEGSMTPRARGDEVGVGTQRCVIARRFGQFVTSAPKGGSFLIGIGTAGSRALPF